MRSVFTDVFPAQSDPALAAVNVPDCVLTGRHCTITGFSFRDVNTVGETFSGSCVNPEHNDPRRCSLHFIKEISPAVLAVESLRRSSRQIVQMTQTTGRRNRQDTLWISWNEWWQDGSCM
jgi:hypothetical protein